MSTDMPWSDEGICAQTDPVLFYPETGQPDIVARAICTRCPVRRKCRDHAITAPEWFGVWGGLGQNERRAIIRQRAAA